VFSGDTKDHVVVTLSFWTSTGKSILRYIVNCIRNVGLWVTLVCSCARIRMFVASIIVMEALISDTNFRVVTQKIYA
jgi:hypothetical protein